MPQRIPSPARRCSPHWASNPGRAFKVTVFQLEAQRLYEVQATPAAAQSRAIITGIGRNFRLKKDNLHDILFRLEDSRRIQAQALCRAALFSSVLCPFPGNSRFQPGMRLTSHILIVQRLGGSFLELL